MHEPSHTLCIVKQIVESPIACLFTYIGLEANYKSNIPQNVPIFHGHVSQFFSHIFGHSTTCTRPSSHILKRCWPSQWYLLAFWRTQSFSWMSIPYPTPLSISGQHVSIPKDVHSSNVIRFDFQIFRSAWGIHLNLTWYLMATIYETTKKWNKIPTMHYLQVCFPMQNVFQWYPNH